MITPVSFKNNHQQTLRGFVHAPKKYDTAAIFLHGFPGSCEGTAARMGKSLAAKGILTLRFDFSGSNKSDGKFEDKLMSQEVKDIKYAIDFLTQKYMFKKLILIGLSTGAIDAALYVHKDRRVDKTVLMGAVSKLNEAVRYDFSDEQVRDFWTKGYVTYSRPGKWTNGMKIKKKFYDEFFTLDIPKAMKKYHRPLLIVHGSQDEAVPATKDPIELYDRANKPKKLVIIRGAGHRFEKAKHWKQLITVILRFAQE